MSALLRVTVVQHANTLCYVDDARLAMRTNELYQRYYGLHIGKVVQVNDPLKIGRIRLECPQFTDDPQTDPLWATVCRPGGGATSVFFTPNEGDQVIFGFEVGDVNGPVILGYAHNSKEQKPPQEVSAEQKKHGIVTAIGSVVFDEDGKKIVVTFNGDSPSTVTMNADGITLDTKGKVVVNAGNVFIGSDTATEPIPLGNQLATWLRTHFHPSGMGPTAPPDPSVLATLDSILSPKNTVD